MQTRIIVTSVDDNPHYMQGLRAYLASIKINSPQSRVRVYLINCEEKYGQTLYLVNSNIEVRHVTSNEQSAYVRNHLRHGLLLETTRDYNQIAWIDNDAIIRKPLDGLWESLTPETLKFVYRKEKRDALKFQGGVYVFGVSEATKKWLWDIMTALAKYNINKKNGDNDWYIPQEYMYTFYKTNKNIEFAPLDQKYNDSKFNKDSVIWHCKHTHFDDPKYQAEYCLYEC